MVSIKKVKTLENLTLDIEFDDGSKGVVHLGPMLPDAILTRPLHNPDFFKLVKMYPDGDGIYWPNNFDLGADMLHYYATTEVIA
jgi:hypothetical protein